MISNFLPLQDELQSGSVSLLFGAVQARQGAINPGVSPVETGMEMSYKEEIKIAMFCQ